MPHDTQYHPNNNPLAFPRSVMSLELRVQSGTGTRKPPLYPQSPLSPRRISTSAQRGINPSDLIPPPSPVLSVRSGHVKNIVSRLQEHTASSGAKVGFPRLMRNVYTTGDHYLWHKMSLMRDSTKAMWSRHGCVIYREPTCVTSSVSSPRCVGGSATYQSQNSRRQRYV